MTTTERIWLVPIWWWLAWQLIKITSVLVLILDIAALFQGEIVVLANWAVGIPGAFVLARWIKAVRPHRT
jgi:hypothetical protein